MEITGFKLKEEIYKSSKTIIYKASDTKKNKNVMIKLLRKEYPTPEEIYKFKYEYDIVKKLEGLEGIIKTYDIIKYKNSLAIIMEDFDGISLNNILAKNIKFNLEKFLIIAIKLIDIIDRIHNKNIIHKDIKPSNIVINLKTLNIKLIDFSISTEILKETQVLINPDHLEGTLAYISPEQTGRMNRSIDYRTDYYSLGVTYYEMITGRLPFEFNDPMELVHSHIAKIPVPPIDIDKSIPKTISNIIIKLLAKNAEDRYQSSEGIKHDLTRCLKLLKIKDKINDFKIAKKDIMYKFHISEKLYGREKEIKELNEIFERITKGEKESAFVIGDPGIGKSVLINEINKPILEKRGFFISGKYDQFKNNIPYSAIIQAFKELSKIILTQSKDEIEKWKKNILEVVGPNGQILISVIPEIEIIIGKQSNVQMLTPIESQKRFNIVFENFVKLFANKNHPLVLFLDDLQWIDKASMQILQVLMEDPELKYFLLIGSFRDKDENINLILKFLDNIKELNINIKKIKLSPLNEKQINQLLVESFHFDNIKITELSRLILLKTNGNPFFILEFLKSLYDKKLIKYNNGWIWDILKIKHEDVTKNVIDIITDNIKKLPKKVLEILEIASCIGINFYFSTLSIITDKTEDEIIDILKYALNAGLIIKIENYAKFIHDKIREAIYLLIDDKDRKNIHYRIGKLFLENRKFKTLENRTFNIADQLNVVKDLLSDKEKLDLIKINIETGQKAKSSSAYDSAIEYFEKAKELLDKNAWDKYYNITFLLYSEWSESEYLARNYKNAEKLFFITTNKAKSIIDKIKIEKIIIDYYTLKIEHNKAIERSIDLVKLIKNKIKHPKRVSLIDVIILLLKFKFNRYIKQNKFNEILNFNIIKDPIKLELLYLLFRMGFASFSIYPNAYIYLAFYIGSYSLKNGISSISAVTFTNIGSVLCVLVQFDLGFKIGKMAFLMMRKFDNKYLSSMQLMIFGSMINHWKEKINISKKYFIEGYKLGLDTGNLQWASYNLNFICLYQFLAGINLEIAKNIYDDNTIPHKKLKQEDANTVFYPFKQFVYNLLGLAKDKYKLIGDVYNENIELPIMKNKKFNSGLGNYYTAKILLLFFLNNYNLAFKNSKEGEKYINTNLGQFQTSLLQLFIALTYLSQYTKLKKKEQKKYFNKVVKTQILIKKWNKSCPENFGQMYYLLSAEMARVKNNDTEAMKCYDKAIKFAKDNEFIYMEALANELAANFYKSRNMDNVFKVYMIEACYCYIKWGAKAKVEELEKQYPDIFEALYDGNYSKYQDILTRTFSTISKTDKNMHSSQSSSSRSLDIDAVMKASLTISSEIEMDSLLTNLIKILTENAGAQKGIIIMNKEGRLTIEAKITTESKKAVILKSIPIMKSKELSHGIINYVERTKEIVNLNDACNDGIFINDIYVKKNKSKSILCMPIILQNNLIGILYLENNLTIKAFTGEHQEVLKILSGQAAISIQNIYLYEGAKEKKLLKKEMKIASDIQKSMLPGELPEIEGYEIDAECIMAKEAGGDLYDVIRLNEDNYLIVIGDVSGKGMPAALYMNSTINIIRTLVESIKLKTKKEGQWNMLSIKDMTVLLNKLLRNIMREGKFVTIFMGILNVKAHSFTYSSSGHDPVIVYNPANNKYENITTKGQACGIIREEIFNKEIEERSKNINVGDYYIFYTDGITESKNGHNEEYMDRFYNSIKKINKNQRVQEVIKYIVNDVKVFSKNAPQYDDMTLLCFKRL